MDGTLVDTEPYWHDVQRNLVAEFGGVFDEEQALRLVGSSLEISAAAMQQMGVPWGTEHIIDHLTDQVMARVRTRVPWRPGARELLADVRAAGVPTALVTMSIRRMATEIAAAVPTEDGRPAFDVIVSSTDVTHPKPHPEAYLRAAELLGVRSEECVAIEDSGPGLAAAVASGARTVGVPHVVELPESDGYTLWPTLEGRSLSDLAGLPGAGELVR